MAESKLHRIFSDKGIRLNREFFRSDADQVKEAIQLAELNCVKPKVYVVVAAMDVQPLQKAVATEGRRTRLRFLELDIPVVALLTFAKDSTVTTKCRQIAELNTKAKHFFHVHQHC